ncbi:ATP-binding protein [Mycobacterium sp. ZZG]
MQPNAQNADIAKLADPVSRVEDLWGGQRVSDLAIRIVAGDHISLRGAPGAGRTSWLRCLADSITRLNPNAIVLLVDASQRAVYDEASFIRHVFNELNRQGIRLETLTADNFEALSQAIRHIDESIVLLIDNYEALRRHLVDSALRSLVNSGRGSATIRLVLAGTDSTSEFQSRTGSAAFSFMSAPTVIVPLDENETADAWKDIVSAAGLPSDEYLKLSSGMYALTGGWPLILKTIGRQMAEDRAAGGSGALSDMLPVLDQFFELQWVRLRADQQSFLVECSRGRVSNPLSSELSATANDLRAIGLIDPTTWSPRGTRWQRFIERSVAAGDRPFLTEVANDSPALQNAAQRQSARVKRWVDGEVWLVNQLPQMVDHAAVHGANVDRNAAMLLSARDRLRGISTRAEIYEVLSGAAWLHDIGHTGGHLAGRVVTDFRHVRKFHGMFSQQIISNDRTSLFPEQWDAYTDEKALAAAVGLLSAFHQRHTVLTNSYWSDTHPPKSTGICDESAACVLCQEAERQYSRTLSQRIQDERLSGFFDPEDLLEATAILRVADAMDIGNHRVSRRIGLGHFGAERFWYGKAASDLVTSLSSAAEWARLVSFDAMHFTLTNLISGAERVLRLSELSSSTLFASDASKEFDALDGLAENNLQVGAVARCRQILDEYSATVNFVGGQDAYRRLHGAFQGADVYDKEDGTFDIVLKMHHGALTTDARDRFDEAAEYIWSEYLGVEYLMGAAGIQLANVRCDRNELTPHCRPDGVRF